MKTILVPTDFSETADNAVDYAIEISKNMNAKIVLLHVFCIPPFHMEIHLLRRNSDSIEKKCMEHLTEIERRIRVQAGPAIEIECVCQRGNVLDTITNYARLQAVNLVVMGMQGSTNLVEKLIGNTTESLLRACPCPVLAIGRHVKFKPPGKILLASDYIESENKAKMVLLKDLVSTFKSQLHVLNIIQKRSTYSLKEFIENFRKLNNSLSGMTHTFHHLHNKNIIHAINGFVAGNDIDLVVIIPHRHSFVENLLQESKTKKMAFDAKIPLLALH